MKIVGWLDGGLFDVRLGILDSGLIVALDSALNSAMDNRLVSGAEQEGLRVSLRNLERGGEVPASRDYPPQIIIC